MISLLTMLRWYYVKRGIVYMVLSQQIYYNQKQNS